MVSVLVMTAVVVIVMEPVVVKSVSMFVVMKIVMMIVVKTVSGSEMNFYLTVSDVSAAISSKGVIGEQHCR